MSSESLDFDGLRPASPFLSDEHREWRSKVRNFVDETIAPNMDAWDEAGTFPDDVYAAAIAAGIFGVLSQRADLAGRLEI